MIRRAILSLLYEDELPLEDKIMTIAKEIYGADGVTYDSKAKKELDHIDTDGLWKSSCMYG